MPGKYRVRLTISGLLLLVSVSACGSSEIREVQSPAITTLAAITQDIPTLQSMEATNAMLSVPPSQVAVPANAPQIIKVNGFKDSGGIWTIVGLVANYTSLAFTDIQIEVELFDASGISIYKARTSTSLYNLSPGERTPFILKASDSLPKVDHYRATLVNEKTVELNRLAIDVQGVTRTLDETGNLHITGMIVNNSSQPAVIHRLAAAAFDNGDQIIAADAAAVAISYLVAGQSAPFRVTMSTPAGGGKQPTNDQIYIDASSGSPADEFALNISQPSYTYMDAFCWLHVLGEVKNNDTQTLNVRLLAAAYDSSGNVLDAASLDLPLPSLAPGETLPYDVDSWGPMSFETGLFKQASSYSVQGDPYWTWVNDKQYLSLVTTINSQVYDGQYGKFTGAVLNNSAGPLENIVIIIGLRDKSTGKIVGTDYTTILEEILPAGNAQFMVDIPLAPGFEPTSADYFVIAEGMQP